MSSVLVVDDDVQGAGLAVRILASMGVEDVAVAGSTAAFAEQVAARPFDLLLLDIRLGGDGDGLDLAQDVQAEDGPAVVMVSGLDSNEAFERALAFGAYGYVLKPYRASELRISVLNALRRHELERHAREHRKDLELAVEQRTAQLQSALVEVNRVNLVREQMLHNCSHELKTPLTPILGWAAYLTRRADVAPEQVQQCAAVIAEQGQRLLVVVERLLAARAVIDGTYDAVLEPLVSDSGAVARQVVAAHPRAVVRAPDHPVGVGLGERELGLVLEQLLDNATRFAAGSDVTVRVEQVSGRVRLTVLDHGPGLPASLDVAQLLEPFVQGDGSATREVGGLGIGLYVVSGVVRARGGGLALEPTPGGGLTVVVDLPSAIWRNGNTLPPEG